MQRVPQGAGDTIAHPSVAMIGVKVASEKRIPVSAARTTPTKPQPAILPWRPYRSIG
jgi:hypothetical protein